MARGENIRILFVVIDESPASVWNEIVHLCNKERGRWQRVVSRALKAIVALISVWFEHKMM